MYDVAHSCEDYNDNLLEKCGVHCQRVCQQQLALETLVPVSSVVDVSVAYCQLRYNADLEVYGSAVKVHVCCKQQERPTCPSGDIFISYYS